MSEEWEDTPVEPEALISLTDRIEFMGISIGMGDYTRLVDPDDPDTEHAPGTVTVPLVTLDLSGHRHDNPDQCIPATAAFLVTSVGFDELVDELCRARERFNELYPHRERRSPQ